MPVIIDTYNVLHVTGILPPELAGVDTAGLIALIQRSRFNRDAVCLVCDGTPKPGIPASQHGSISVVYAGTISSADDVIEQIIERSTAPRRLTVVSSDRRIQKAAARRRCRVMPADVFLSQLAIDCESATGLKAKINTRPTEPLEKEDVDDWIKHFGLEEQDLNLPASGDYNKEDDSVEDAPGRESIDDIDMGKILGEE